MRRTVPLLLTFAGLSLATSACKSKNHGTGGNTSTGSGGMGGMLLMPPDIPRTQPESTLAPERKSCMFKQGAWAAETIGTDYPIGKDIPIKHVLVIMQENRSFDHYLGRLVAQGYYKGGDFSSPTASGFTQHDAVDVPPASWAMPDATGAMIPPHPDNEYCYGLNHGWSEMHFDWDNGKNDGFILNNDPNGQRTMFYQDDTNIPFYYALANTFSIGDRYFCSVLTSTWPNRLYLMAATSYGVGDNSFVTLDTPDKPVVQIFSQLNAGGHTWKDYTDGPHQVLFFPAFGFAKGTSDHFGDVKCDLFNDIDHDTLPDVGIIMGDEVGGELTDEGPPGLPAIGGLMTENIVRHLFASPAWKDTVLFITYDENGGAADHVPPEPACEPDGLLPHDDHMNPLPGKFDRYGFRVPFIVVSPYTKAHFVSHQIYDHTSITRFIEARFGLPAMSGRDANATPPYEMFDFQNPPFMTPPNIAAKTTVPQSLLTQCNQALAPIGCGQ